MIVRTKNVLGLDPGADNECVHLVKIHFAIQGSVLFSVEMLYSKSIFNLLLLDFTSFVCVYFV